MLKIFKHFYLVMFLLFIFAIQNVTAQAEEFFGIGAELSKDTYNNKVIVVGILDNSPAQKAGINIGDEIISINNEKVKKLTLCDIVSKIRGEENTQLKLRIKENFFKRRTVELKREKILVCDCPQNQVLESHWAQIATYGYNQAKIMPSDAIKKFSRKYRNTVIALNEYWYKRKQIFTVGYNTCANYSNKNNQELCLIHLTDRESAKTNADKAVFKFLNQK